MLLKSWASQAEVQGDATPAPYSLCCQEPDTHVSHAAWPHATATSRGQTTQEVASDSLMSPKRQDTAGELELGSGDSRAFI